MSETVKQFDPNSASQNLLPITMTDAAVSYVQKKLRERGHGIGIRLGTKKAGCSGLEYVLDYIDEVAADDHVFTVAEGLVVVVNPQSFPFIHGTIIDFEKLNLAGGKLKFINPNEKNSCGCGESFGV